MIHKILIFLLLFISGGAIIILGVASYFYIILVALLLFCLVFGGREIRISMSSIRNIGILTGLFLALLAIRGQSTDWVREADILIKLLVTGLFSVYVSTFYTSTEDFFTELVSVFESLIKLSLVTTLIINLLPFTLMDVGHRLAVTNDQYQTFLGIAYARTRDFSKYHFYRNEGIFWEPGVYGAILVVVFMIKVFYLKQKKQTYWYYIGVISSASMGSILIFFVFNFFRRISSFSNPNKKRRPIVIKILIALPLMVLFDVIYSYSTDILTVVEIIFNRKVTTDSSINTRYQHVYYGFLAAKDQLWIGHGLDWKAYYKITFDALNTSKESYNGGITSAIITILYCYGIVYLLAYLIAMVRSSIKISPINAILVFFTFVALLMLEPIHFSLFLIFVFTFSETKTGGAISSNAAKSFEMVNSG